MTPPRSSVKAIFIQLVKPIIGYGMSMLFVYKVFEVRKN